MTPIYFKDFFTKMEIDKFFVRGGGLEPPTTGPEPDVLPITPSPIGWAQ